MIKHVFFVIVKKEEKKKQGMFKILNSPKCQGIISTTKSDGKKWTKIFNKIK